MINERFVSVMLAIEYNLNNIGDKAMISIYLYRQIIEQNIITFIQIIFGFFYLFIFSQIFILMKF